MPTDIKKLFTSLGLSETETKLYLASLELGPSSIQDIAKKAGLSRTATYASVEELQRRGLMSTYEKGKKRVFAAEEPERVVDHFTEAIHGMEQQLGTLRRMLPELKMMGGGERPTVRFFEGVEGLRALFTDLGQVKSSFIYELANMNDVYTYLDKETLKDVRLLVDPKQTKIRVLHIGENKYPREETEYCEAPSALGDFHGDIWIYHNRVAFITLIGKITVVILESQPFADTAKFLFEMAWHSCVKPAKK